MKAVCWKMREKKTLGIIAIILACCLGVIGFSVHDPVSEGYGLEPSVETKFAALPEIAPPPKEVVRRARDTGQEEGQVSSGLRYLMQDRDASPEDFPDLYKKALAVAAVDERKGEIGMGMVLESGGLSRPSKW